jgi:hypothetical protein
MSRNFKAFGLALIALSAFGAIMAPGASAAGERFHCEKAPCIITSTSESTQGWVIGSSQVVCHHAEFKGTALNLTETTWTLHPIYNNCEFLEEPAAVDTGGCSYVIGAETTAAQHLPVSTECTGAEKIKVTTGACNLTFGSQAATGGFKFTNAGSGSTRDGTTTATAGVTFSKAGPLCFLVAGTTATYFGPTTLKCYEDKGTSGPIDLNTTTYTEGAEVGCWWE